MRRPRSAPRFRVEPLEDRSVPAFVTAALFPVGTNGGEGSSPDGIATADFNRDGKLDVATANPGQSSVSLLLGNGAGKFAAAKNFPIGRKPVGLTAADVNGDGKPDLVTANTNDDSVTVLLGNGLGGFVLAGTVGGLNNPVAVGVADFDGDGTVDLAVPNNGSNSVALLIGQGKGKFLAGPVLTTGDSPTAIAVGDFNGDTRPDFATTSGGFGHLDVTLNLGNGAFAPPANWETGFCANALAVADFNHDQKLDIAVACTFPSGFVSILLGAGDGTFPTFVNYNPGNQSPRTIAVADFNGDGHPDVATANGSFTTNTVTVLTGTGDGTLNPASVFTAGNEPRTVAAGDFNRDGLADLVATNLGLPAPRAWAGPVGVVSLLLSNGDGSVHGSPGLVVDGPGGAVTGDLTGDGLADLAVVTAGGHRGFYVFPSLGNGLFGDRIASPTIDSARVLAVGHFNTDTVLDAAVLAGQDLHVLLGTGGGAFGSPVPHPIGGSPEWVSVGDFNGDQKADLVLATRSGVSLLLGNGDGSFQLPVGIVAGGESKDVKVADLNKDGKPDLAVLSGPNKTVTVLLGNGDGTFTNWGSYPTQVGPGSVSVGDFNRDGRPDFAVTTFFGPGLMVYQNKGAGKFFLRGEFETDSRPLDSLAVDVTGDGKLDLVTANSFAATATVLPGTGLGTFGKKVRYSVGDGPGYLAAADFNGDGRLDVAVSSGNTGWVTLLHTPTPAHHLRVTTNVATVSAGQPVTITVTAVDTAGHPARSFGGLVTLTSTDPRALLPLPYRFTAADQGVKRLVVYPRTAGGHDFIARSAGVELGAATVGVAAGAATHLKLLAPTTATAGTEFTVTVRACDKFGNPTSLFAGTVHFTATDLNQGIAVPADYTFAPADGGSRTFPVTLLTAGVRTLTVTAGAWKATVAVKVVAGALSRFDVTGLPATVTANTVRYVTVVAKDAYGNTITNYAGAVAFANAGGTAVLPAAYTFKPTDLGKKVFKVTFQTPGADQSLTVADGAVTASVTGITVV